MGQEPIFFFFSNTEWASLSCTLGFVEVFPWEALPEGEDGHACPIPWCGSRKCHSHLICNIGLLTNISAVVGKSLRNCVYVITHFWYNRCVQLLLQNSLWLSSCCCIPVPSNKLQNHLSGPVVLQVVCHHLLQAGNETFSLMEDNTQMMCVPGWVWV